MSEALTEQIQGRRMRTKRRQFGWRTVMYGFLRSRRRRPRRHGDDVLFLDWHHPWLFFLSVGTMILSAVDAFITIELLNRGMFEANPAMAWVLQYGTNAFAASKLSLTGLGILTLVYLGKARFLDRVRAGLFLTAFFSGYACLVCYETVQLLQLL